LKYVYESESGDGRKIQQPVTAKKRIWFSSMPNVLLVQLKRFDPEGKLDAAVHFEEKLDLRPFCQDSSIQLASKSCEYTLIGVVMHEGTADAGHYWAFVRTEADEWFRCNDVRVEAADLTSVLEEGSGGPGEASAYLLLYQQC
jgi:ubiquitin carboxyl-terminal hydrolase 7